MFCAERDEIKRPTNLRCALQFLYFNSLQLHTEENLSHTPTTLHSPQRPGILPRDCDTETPTPRKPNKKTRKKKTEGRIQNLTIISARDKPSLHTRDAANPL